jgi:hypothetical protein
MTLTEEMLAARVAHLAPVDVRLARRWLGVSREDIAGPPVGMLVGEAPGPNTSGRLPLFPWPASSAAGRLLKLSGLKPGDFLGRFFRRNLFDIYTDTWHAPMARERAEQILEEIAAVGSLRVLLLGTRVAAAFGLDSLWSRRTVERLVPLSNEQVLIELASIPHPSGRNQVYNDAKARAAAQTAVLWAADMI